MTKPSAVVCRWTGAPSAAGDDDNAGGAREDINRRCKIESTPLQPYWKAEIGPMERALTNTPLYMTAGRRLAGVKNLSEETWLIVFQNTSGCTMKVSTTPAIPPIRNMRSTSSVCSAAPPSSASCSISKLGGTCCETSQVLAPLLRADLWKRASTRSSEPMMRSPLRVALLTAIFSASCAFFESSAWFHTSAMFTPRASKRRTACDLE
mmetsp:Transcript_34660/g.70795  ORF Transcript_34660/g.70795 Transcript_34660/m.70795 type:complete len:208 (+) Transcript_34660:916-1539(+)